MIRQAFFDRVKGVEDEFVVSSLALLRLDEELRKDPLPLVRIGHGRGTLRHTRENLEKTYIVRMFAEFEASLRQIYMQVRRRPRLPEGRISLLINNVAAHSRIRPQRLIGAHRVREYRNTLVHEGKCGYVLTLGECKSHLCAFLAAIVG